MGGGKHAAQLGGRPLISYPLEALAQACDPVAVVCKAATELPDLGDYERWDEPDEPQHPLTGIVHALERAGAPVLVCAADMPFVTADACRTLLAGAGGGGSAPAAVAAAKGEIQPVFGVYSPASLDGLRAAAPGAPLMATVEGLDPARVALPPPMLRSVNTPEELAEAEEELSSG